MNSFVFMVMAPSMRAATFLWFLTILTFCNCFCNGSSSDVTCVESEKIALLQFKQDLKDDTNRLSSWAVEENCCKWTGIVCDNITGHVNEIHLHDHHAESYYTGFKFEEELRYRLGGRINPSLLNLKHLKHLDLSCNNFKGIEIPSFIGSLGNLRYLNLSRSGFKGMIPPQLGNLTMIRYLSLRMIFQYEYPRVENLQWLSGLSLLHHLDMSGVDLSNEVDWLQVMHSLPSLVELHLAECQLGYIPPLKSVNFTSLAILDLSVNYFFSPFPGWVSSLSSLVSLELAGCGFHGPIPGGLRNMTSLRKLDVSVSFDLSPSVLEGLFWHNNLISLDLSYNDIQGSIPQCLQNMTSLRDLYLSGNNFNSTIPNWLYSLSHLELLDLSSSTLKGEISSAIGNMTSLISLDLANNQLTGRVPYSLGNLCNLRRISLSRNDFREMVSEVVKAFGGCTSNRLDSLKFESNRLYGHLPDELGQFNKLADLSLKNNSISGPIPASLGRLRSLQILDISDNQFNGTLPESLGQLLKLRELRIQSNLLKGVVSEVHFVNLTQLRLLNAEDNALTLNVSDHWVPPFQLLFMLMRSCQLGPQFPSWLRWQRRLTSLDISNTGIADTIPTWFWTIFDAPSSYPFVFPVLVDLSSNHLKGPLPLISPIVDFLDLSDNLFSGSLYPFLCNTTKKPTRLQVLNVDNNLLSGEIPDCWMNWQSLTALKLSNNNLMGTIPRSMGYLSSLVSLNMRKNNLSGELPKNLMNWTQLEIIDLTENEFSGSLPTWIGGQFTKMKVLNLRSNKFSGDIPDELCHHSSIQVLDLANNNLSGMIPRCFNNFSVLADKNSSTGIHINILVNDILTGQTTESVLLFMKGREDEYKTILQFVTSLDLSGNNLSREIPIELMSLLGLQSLNLSGNHLTGRIPEKIGEMNQLESLDFSMNQLSGEIPSSVSSLTFLSHLNLSYNNLNGQIPSSTQIQTFNEYSFIGNTLCGPPLTKSCNKHEIKPNVENAGEEDDDIHEVDWFFVTGIITGFIFGFWAVLGPLIVSMSWRIAYFQFLNNTRHKLCDVVRKYCCNVFTN